MPRRLEGRPRQRRNHRILAATNICHICGHPGADAIDHVIPVVECDRRGIDAEQPANLRPAHHDTPCPECGLKCNRVKSDKPFAPIIRRSRSLRR